MDWLIFIFLLAFALIGHGYLWIAPINRLHAWAGPRIWVDQLTNLCLVAFCALPLLVVWDLWPQLDQPWYHYWSNASALARYTQLCTVWGIGKIFYDWFDQRNVDSPKNLLSWKKRWVDIPEIPPAYGFYTRLLTAVPTNQFLTLSIDEKRLAIPGLPEQLDGFTIAHISDIHITGRIGKSWFEILADQVNQLQADAIIITGDILENKNCWSWLDDSLAKLQAAHGVYFILGNHDYFVDTDHTRKLLSDAGLVCVSGKWHETTWNNTSILLSGNERPWGTDSLDDTQPATLSTADHFHVALIHSPDQFSWACQNHANLVLAGHTHGGQIRLPVLGAVACPSLHGTHYACGVFRQDNSIMHVTRGFSGETPVRWNCPPEIALLELTAAC